MALRRDAPEMLLRNLTLCARIVHHNKIFLATKLIAESHFFASQVQVSNQRVVLTDPLAFSNAYAAAKRADLEAESLTPTADDRTKRNKVQALTRLALLWRARHPALSITAF